MNYEPASTQISAAVRSHYDRQFPSKSVHHRQDAGGNVDTVKIVPPWAFDYANFLGEYSSESQKIVASKPPPRHSAKTSTSGRSYH